MLRKNKKVAAKQQHLEKSSARSLDNLIGTLIELRKPVLKDVPIDSVVTHPQYNILMGENPDLLSILQSSIKEFGPARPAIVRQLGDEYQALDGVKLLDALRVSGCTKVTVLSIEADDDLALALIPLLNWDRNKSYAVKALMFHELKKQARQLVLEGDIDETTRQYLSRVMGMGERSISKFEKIVDCKDADTLVRQLDAKEITFEAAYNIAIGNIIPGIKNPNFSGGDNQSHDCKISENGPYPFCAGCSTLRQELEKKHLAQLNKDMPMKKSSKTKGGKK